jgi:hypothetical protein
MQVLLTIGLILVAGIWWLSVYRKLLRMREGVRLAWKKLEADQSSDPIRLVYNKHVSMYNAALEAFPSNIVAPLAGLKPARSFERPSERQ